MIFGLLLKESYSSVWFGADGRKHSNNLKKVEYLRILGYLVLGLAILNVILAYTLFLGMPGIPLTSYHQELPLFVLIIDQIISIALPVIFLIGVKKNYDVYINSQS